MVDQLWLWITDAGNCVTFFPSTERHDSDEAVADTANLRERIIADINGDPRFATQCENVFEFAALVVARAVQVFLEDIEDEDLQVFRIFEEYISILTENQTLSFKTFRDRYQSQGAYGTLHEHGSRMSKTLTKLQQDDIRDNEHDLTDLLELRDVEDELGTMRKLFKDQLRVITELISNCYKEEYKRGFEILQDAQRCVESYLEHVDDMLVNCRSAQDSFVRLLDMKQKQANVWEAWAAREANEVASGQSRAVLVFTVFTIIFLPLSFFTSLFGMNAAAWSGVDSNVQLHIIFAWMSPVSAVVTISALLIAFNESVRDNTVWYAEKALEKLARKDPNKRYRGFPDLSRRSTGPTDLRAGLQAMSSPAFMMTPFAHEAKPRRTWKVE